jgi:diguanylate cyclase (GGDEF)-like protein
MLQGATEKNARVHGLSELSRFLQSCVDMDEAVRLLKHEIPLLMRAQGGALYLMEDARDQLRQAFSWGGEPYAETFEPNDCWAVRLGKAYHQPQQAGAACCAHLHSERPRARSDVQCLPIVAHGELIGLLVLDTGLAQEAQPSAEIERHRRVTMEEVGLSIGLLKLRESLRQQSIRDGLTGLYNRRFLEESAQREVLRAARLAAHGGNAGVALMMIDIDHFKRFNDQHGHEVGDHVLRSVAQVLLRHTRGSDVAARYGGEEFTLVLVDMPSRSALERAEQVRADVAALALHAFGKAVGPVTVSIGVAQFPADAATVDALFLAADRALYAAKDGGRNRVALASDLRPRLPPTEGSPARNLRERRVGIG